MIINTYQSSNPSTVKASVTNFNELFLVKWINPPLCFLKNVLPVISLHLRHIQMLRIWKKDIKQENS